MTALLLGGSAAAQSPGTLLVGGFVSWTHFDSKWGLNTDFGNSIGYGGRVGAFVAPNWNVEADGQYIPAQAATGSDYHGIGIPGGDVKGSNISARLVYSFPLGNLPSIHLGAGAVLQNFRGDENQGGSIYQFGANGLIGFNLGFGGVSLRVDGLVNYFPSNDGRVDFGAQAGLQLSPDLRNLFGGGATANPVMYAPYVWWDELDAPLPGTVELGGFVQWTFFDDHAGIDNVAVAKDGLGYGGRLGVFLSDPRWEIEGDGYYSPQDNDITPNNGITTVNAHAFAARLNYNFPLFRFMNRQSQFIIGAGPTRTSYKFKNGDSELGYQYNYGGSALAGIRLGVANRTALRFDGVLDYMPNHENNANMNIHVRGGLSFLLGGARPEVMCTYPGLESIPASSPNCVAPPPPPPPPPPPAMCQYNPNILATDPACVPPLVAVDTTKITAPIYFDFDKSTIRPDAAATLDAKVPWLQANPGMRIRIEGNADERGSDEYNLALGQRRAASAKRYLVDHGIAADRFDLV
ncbi:MAG TPA: OmpA family protein, partial [Gemmatimonadaceae bacterium]